MTKPKGDLFSTDLLDRVAAQLVRIRVPFSVEPTVTAGVKTWHLSYPPEYAAAVEEAYDEVIAKLYAA